MSLVEHHHSGQRAGDGREDFASLRRGGLDWDEFGLHLFVTGNARFWDPRGIDFSTDALDWREMRDDERRFVTYLVAQADERPSWKPGDFFGETFRRR